MRARRICLLGLVFRASHQAVPAGSTNVVTDRGSQIKGRDSVGRADFDDPAGILGTAELVAKLSFIPVERVELVAQKSPAESSLSIWRSAYRPVTLIVMLTDGLGLLIALRMQFREQAFQVWIMKDAHRDLLMLTSPAPIIAAACLHCNQV